MTDYKKLCEDLRAHAEYSDDGDYIDLFPYVEGFEELIAENERLKKYEDKCHDCPIVCAKTEVIKANEEIDRLKKQLDAAVAEIAHIAKDGKTWMCPYCKNCNGTSYGFADCKKGSLCNIPYTLFEWRGVEDAADCLYRGRAERI